MLGLGFILFAAASPAQVPVVKAVGFAAPRLAAPRLSVGTVGGQEADGWIELSAPAVCQMNCDKVYVNGKSAGGMNIVVSSSNSTLAKLHAPVVFFLTGETRKSFTVLTAGVSAPTDVTISAQREGSPAQSTTLHIVPPSLTGLTVDTANVIGGTVVHGKVTFNGPPSSAGALVAKLSANPPALGQIPQSVALDANTTAATFDIKTAGVASNSQLTISASNGDQTQKATISLTPAVLTDFKRAFPCLCGDLTATLSGAAPAGGLTIAVSSSNPNVASVPPSFVVPAGASSAAVPLTDHPTYSEQKATISATLNGVTKKWDETVLANIKADLYFYAVALQDRFGNAITHPADAQNYKVCVSFGLAGTNGYGNYLTPPATTLHVAYLTPTGTGTSVGRESDMAVSFGGTYPAGWRQKNNDTSKEWYEPPTCLDMPGIQQSGGYTDLHLTINPSHNNPDESNFGNNAYNMRITRQ